MNMSLKEAKLVAGIISQYVSEQDKLKDIADALNYAFSNLRWWCNANGELDVETWRDE